MSATMEEAVDGNLTQLPPPGLVSRLDSSRDENGRADTVPECGEKEEAKGTGEQDEKEYFCGCGPWHPVHLQIFRDARFFTFLLCLFATIEGALVSGFTSVVLSTLERRYGLSSTATGAIASTFDAAVLVSVVFISYFGGRGHKPRWLGASLIVQATGSFIFSLPQFVFGRYRVGSSGALSTEACLDGQDFTDCTSSTYGALFFFVLGNIFIGVGAAPLFTVGTTYLDEIVRPKHVSLHLGLFYMTSIVGPALGYALGGPFLSIYVDPWEDTHLTPSDPGWVGAWWLSFIFCGVVSLIISVPFFCYPRLSPSSRAIREEREREMAKKTEKPPRVSEGGNKIQNAAVSFLWDLRRIVINPSWIFMTVAICSSILVVSGFASFGPKYVETQFGIPPSVASLAVGAVAIPTGGAGVVVGGLIIYFLKLKGRRVPLLQMIISAVAVLPLLGLLLHCPTSDIAGITSPYPDGARDLGDTRFLNSTCISSCNCTSSVYEPVCGADGFIYFSPCRAGCPPPSNASETDYEQCGCVTETLLTANSTANSTASDGPCDNGCRTKLVFFLLLIGLGLFTVFMLQIPNVLVTIRCVAEDQRTLAIGTQSFFWRLLGSIPGPILFGAIFDSTCLFWQHQCGRRGNCWVYDNTALSQRAVVLAVLAMAGYFTSVFFVWLFYPRTRGESGEGEEGGGEKTAVTELEIRGEVGEGGEGGGEGGKAGGEEGKAETSVIGKMQNRNSTAQLLEVSSSSSSNGTDV